MAPRSQRRDGRQCDALPRPPLGPRRGGLAIGTGQRLFDQVEALVESVTAEDQVRFGFGMGDQQVVAVAHHVGAANGEGIDAQLQSQLIESALDGEDHLTEPVSAERARRRIVGVDGLGVDALDGASVDGHRLRTAVEHDAWRVISVGAAVAQHGQLHRGQCAVGAGAERDVDAHGMAMGGRGELVGPRHLVRDRPPGAQHGDRDEVLGEHLLLAAETAPDARGVHAKPVLGQVEQKAQFLANQKRNL